jgi:hypothetical protein
MPTPRKGRCHVWRRESVAESSRVRPAIRRIAQDGVCHPVSNISYASKLRCTPLADRNLADGVRIPRPAPGFWLMLARKRRSRSSATAAIRHFLPPLPVPPTVATTRTANFLDAELYRHTIAETRWPCRQAVSGIVTKTGCATRVRQLTLQVHDYVEFTF